MYGKSFESKFTGSMVGAGFHVFAVWDYVTTKMRRGVIEINPKLLAFTLAGAREGAEQEVIDAIGYLCRPDPGSRSKDEDGRRMIREGEFQYRIVNAARYEGIKTEADRREYNRVKQAEYRAKHKEDSCRNGSPRRKRGAGRKDGLPDAQEAAYVRNVEQFGQEEADRMQMVKEKLAE